MKRKILKTVATLTLVAISLTTVISSFATNTTKSDVTQIQEETRNALV